MKDLLILKGHPTGPLRKVRRGVYSFDLVTSEGFYRTRKSFPKEEITYTVFITDSIRRNLKWRNTDITQLTMKVWGAPTLDFPVTECPGDIGVIGQSIVVLQETESVPPGTDDVIPFTSILIPVTYTFFKPKPEKITAIISFYREHGYFDIPILVTRELKILHDGYARLFAARMLNIENVAVKYIDAYDELYGRNL